MIHELLSADASIDIGSIDIGSIDIGSIDVAGDQLGEGYGLPTDAMLEAVRLMAQTEGLLLDPVYGGKAFAGVLSAVRNGVYQSGDAILF